MKDQNKKSKKKILLYYLILAACLLVIAAVTVTVIFTVGRPDNSLVDSKPGVTNPDNKDPDEGNKPGNTDPDDENKPGNTDPDDENKDKPTGSDDKFALPIANATVMTSYDFAYDATLDRYCVHQGMDFEAEAGTEVCAVLAGTVIEVVTDHILGENYVKIQHANNTVSTYKYIEAKENLKVGNTVKKGEVIGTVAAANGMEMKQGDHLHFEMSVNGKSADPAAYLDISEK